MLTHGGSVLVAYVDVFHEAAVESPVENILGERHRLAFEVQDVDGVRNHVARMAAPEPLVALHIVFLHESLRQALRTKNLLVLAIAFEDLDKLRRARAALKHLILNTAQEGLVT